MKGTLTGRCPFCRERHAGDCPPHEVRTTGVAWFRLYIDELEAEVERLRTELTDTRNAVKLIIGRDNHIPWPDVPEKEVDGFLDYIRRQREVAEAQQKGK